MNALINALASRDNISSVDAFDWVMETLYDCGTDFKLVLRRLELDVDYMDDVETVYSDYIVHA